MEPPTAIVEAGETRTFRTSFSDREEPTDLRIRYEIDGDGTIERVDTTDGWQCTFAGNAAECTKDRSFNFTNLLTVTVRAGSDNGSAATFRMIATAGPVSAPVARSVASATLQFFAAAVVDTVADSGPGSLRAAIEQANSSTRPVKIVFRIPAPVPSEGWFTLIPVSPLPAMTGAHVFVDGHSQTRFTGDTNARGPEIAIDGRLAHRGLEIHSRCLARVKGLALGNFDANQGLWFTKNGPCETINYYTDYREVADNYIGTDPTGTVAWPNRRGLRGDFGSGMIRNNVISGNTYSGLWIWVSSDRYSSYTIEGNKIGTAADGIAPLPNGAAGMLLGDRVSADVRQNVIANHPGMGIALVRGDTYVQIRENSMRNNGGIGIDWGIDGTSPLRDDRQTTDPNAPTLLSAHYDAGTDRTYFTGRSTAQRPPSPNVVFIIFDFYANRDAGGGGEEWLSGVHINFTDAQAFEAWVPGDLRGKWLNATVTRVPGLLARPPRVSSEQLLMTYGDESTSEFSNAVLVP
ncbi:MAG TPA: right-handed parallel beta-helix repeat-containing protein [Thermoanaerobaculia bacterium]|nr:right-handed parallel beta-helix repeat-containing protein [Thermoanaerobaculia bacterium]